MASYRVLPEVGGRSWLNAIMPGFAAALHHAPKLLSVDFDGVLHPSTDIEDLAASGLSLMAYAQSRPHLLRWAPLLAQTLHGTSCELIVHSSWRERALDSDLRRLLEPSGLAERFIGSAPRNRSRERAILEVAAMMDVQASELVILDDAVAEFEELAPWLIACNPLLGVSDPLVLNELRIRLFGQPSQKA